MDPNEIKFIQLAVIDHIEWLAKRLDTLESFSPQFGATLLLTLCVQGLKTLWETMESSKNYKDLTHERFIHICVKALQEGLTGQYPLH